ncbi:MAG: acyl-CoA dehydrogenase family protein [Acidobacteriota bacterium]|nr:acyl-CoA dehydrogenase family protein [Acidobacteriota bacterium]
MQDLEQFRADTRSWLEENCPPTMRTPTKSDKDYCWGGRNYQFQSDEQRLWMERMGARGWTAPTWPKEYGGGGLTKEEARVLKQELKRIGARQALFSFGISMLGPALLKFGNEEQKKRHIPKIVKGETRWCQGYSEPNAGSDLAGLGTRAEDKGDHYVVNGQKIWASYADEADWIFCLVRTNTEGKKQAGISFVLFDMVSEGVTTRPIRLISGASPFCEIFFDNVKVPKTDLVGQENAGWTIAKYLLTHEREMISGFGAASMRELGDMAVEMLGLQDGKLADGVLRGDIARQDIDAAAFMFTLERTRDEAKAGVSLGAVSSMLKYYGTELNKRRHELILNIEGMNALAWDGEAYNNGALSRSWLRTKANSIEGGTSEIQLNIVAKHILGLPG